MSQPIENPPMPKDRLWYVTGTDGMSNLGIERSVDQYHFDLTRLDDVRELSDMLNQLESLEHFVISAQRLQLAFEQKYSQSYIRVVFQGHRWIAGTITWRYNESGAPDGEMDFRSRQEPIDQLTWLNERTWRP